MKYLHDLWRENKLKASLYIGWLVTVLTSFLGDSLISVKLPFVGALFPFRIFLPITFLLYLIYSFRKRIFFWKENSKAEKITFILIVVLFLHSFIGLAFSIDFAYSFRRVFNLCMDLCLFFLMIQLCSDKKLFKQTMKACALGFLMLVGLGLWECVIGLVFHVPVHFQTINLFGWEIISPEVTYNNTNDFATAVVFLCMLLTTWLLQRRSIQKKGIAFLCISFFFTFLLIEFSSARLLSIAFWLMLFVLLVYMLAIRDKRAIVAISILSVFLLIFSFTKKFDLRDSIQNIFSEKPSYNHQARPEIALKDQFFETDPETGDMYLSAEHSAGVRGLLLNHAIQCFVNSKGMGVGVGNTEKMAQMLNVTQTKSIWAIHCFLARMMGDYGIWFFLPILALGIVFIKFIACKISKKGFHRGYAVFLCGALMAFALVSSSPADAQDVLPMWMFLAVFIKQIRLEDHNKKNLLKEENV